MEPWNINPSWIMPIQIKSVLMSMSRGFLQDFTYILVAKSKDLAARHVNFSSNTSVVRVMIRLIVQLLN